MFKKLINFYESKEKKHNRLNEKLTGLKRKLDWARTERQKRHEALLTLEADPLSTADEQKSMMRSLSLLDDSIYETSEKINETEAKLLLIEY